MREHFTTVFPGRSWADQQGQFWLRAMNSMLAPLHIMQQNMPGSLHTTVYCQINVFNSWGPYSHARNKINLKSSIRMSVWVPWDLPYPGLHFEQEKRSSTESLFSPSHHLEGLPPHLCQKTRTALVQITYSSNWKVTLQVQSWGHQCLPCWPKGSFSGGNTGPWLTEECKVEYVFHKTFLQDQQTLVY